MINRKCRDAQLCISAFDLLAERRTAMSFYWYITL